MARIISILRQIQISYGKETSAQLFLLLLIAADLFFIALHFLLEFTPIISFKFYSIGTDRGYAEFYQYCKLFWIIVLLLTLSKRTKEIGYLAWVLLFAYLFFDDALSIHEKFGWRIANQLEFAPFWGLRLQDFGELAVIAVASALLLPTIVFCYFRGSAVFKKTSDDLFVLLLMIAVFGVFVDLLHVVVEHYWLHFLFGVIEDGGEMIVVSLVVWYVFLLNISNKRSGLSFSRLILTGLTTGFAFRESAVVDSRR